MNKDPYQLAQEHLKRAQTAAWDPVDWVELSTFAFYCLEAAVMAAAAHVGYNVPPSHPAKARAATDLARDHGLTDVSTLLYDLNAARKSSAYGDTAFPNLDAEDVVRELEDYLDEVGTLLDADDEEDDT